MDNLDIKDEKTKIVPKKIEQYKMGTTHYNIDAKYLGVKRGYHGEKLFYITFRHKCKNGHISKISVIATEKEIIK